MQISVEQTTEDTEALGSRINEANSLGGNALYAPMGDDLGEAAT